ncbi:hypothetical protein C1H46_001722 [Malus baccata]|uniref:Uncharacterized protein n=1 Tax=Malus baccata TaxID=106549 RepID=A0A540NNU7_MALBA|nr:hypothetical protein C1H46_001722 [Malus baccata]
MVNLNKDDGLRLPFWSTTGCSDIVSPFEQLKTIEAIEFMTGLLRHTYFDSPYSGLKSSWSHREDVEEVHESEEQN